MILSPVITHRGYQLADVAGVQLLSMHSNGARERFTRDSLEPHEPSGTKFSDFQIFRFAKTGSACSLLLQ